MPQCSAISPGPSSRIGYVDAMRGFTMVLVVYSHVCAYCLGDYQMALNDVFFLFRLPCFFFLSGWLFWPVRRPVGAVVRHKLRVQIVPTFVFLLLLAPPPLFFSRLGATKGGYWFTFALFEFFVIYLLSWVASRRWRHGEVLRALVAVLLGSAAFFYDVFYHRYFSHMGWLTSALGLLSFSTWRYYLFFYLGTLVKRHFQTFNTLVARPWVVPLLAVGFLLVACRPHQESPLLAFLVFVAGGSMGLLLVFCLFRSFARQFLADRPLGRALQYVGRRTLDVYLLHYFFLPRFLLPWAQQWVVRWPLPAQMGVALLLALAITVLCLGVSRVLRHSHFLAYWLFGQPRAHSVKS